MLAFLPSINNTQDILFLPDSVTRNGIKVDSVTRNGNAHSKELIGKITPLHLYSVEKIDMQNKQLVVVNPWDTRYKLHIPLKKVKQHQYQFYVSSFI